MQLQLLAAEEPKALLRILSLRIPYLRCPCFQCRVDFCIVISSGWMKSRRPSLLLMLLILGITCPFWLFLLQYVQGITSRLLSMQPLFLKLFRSLLTPAVLLVCLSALLDEHEASLVSLGVKGMIKSFVLCFMCFECFPLVWHLPVIFSLSYFGC